MSERTKAIAFACEDSLESILVVWEHNRSGGIEIVGEANVWRMWGG